MTVSSSLRITLATLVLASTALVAQAQQGQSRGAGQAPRATAESLAQLKEQLNLSTDQQNAWAQYQTAVLPSERQWEQRGADKPALTEEQKAEINKKREEGKQAREAAKNTFRAQLTAAQQQIFDEAAPKPASRSQR